MLRKVWAATVAVVLLVPIGGLLLTIWILEQVEEWRRKRPDYPGAVLRPGESLVFVYGTLRRGGENHHLLHGSRCVRERTTTADVSIWSNGSFPLMARQAGGRVVGEVYAVSEWTLAQLDRLEGHPSFYEREQLVTRDGDVCWAYLITPRYLYAGLPMVEGGDWVKKTFWRDPLTNGAPDVDSTSRVTVHTTTGATE